MAREEGQRATEAKGIQSLSIAQEEVRGAELRARGQPFDRGEQGGVDVEGAIDLREEMREEPLAVRLPLDLRRAHLRGVLVEEGDVFDRAVVREDPLAAA